MFLEGKRTERVRVELRSDTLDFSAIDPAVTQDILNQIKKADTEGKIKWIVQPDGKIFHKKEEKKDGQTPCKE